MFDYLSKGLEGFHESFNTGAITNFISSLDVDVQACDYKNISGSGNFSEVYIKDDLVLKFYNDDAYNLFVDYVINQTDKDIVKHLPEIIARADLLTLGLKIHSALSDMRFTHCVLMKKLTPNMNYYAHQRAEEHGYVDADTSIWVNYEEISAVHMPTWNKSLEALNEAFVFIYDNTHEEWFFTRFMFEWDLHDRNVMDNGDIPIIVDPWCYSK